MSVSVDTKAGSPASGKAGDPKANAASRGGEDKSKVGDGKEDRMDQEEGRGLDSRLEQLQERLPSLLVQQRPAAASENKERPAAAAIAAAANKQKPSVGKIRGASEKSTTTTTAAAAGQQQRLPVQEKKAKKQKLAQPKLINSQQKEAKKTKKDEEAPKQPELTPLHLQQHMIPKKLVGPATPPQNVVPPPSTKIPPKVVQPSTKTQPKAGSQPSTKNAPKVVPPSSDAPSKSILPPSKTKPNIVPSPTNIAPKLVKNAPKVGQMTEKKAGEEILSNPKKEMGDKVNLERQSLCTPAKQTKVVNSTKKESPAVKPPKGRGRPPKKEKISGSSGVTLASPVEKTCTEKLKGTELGQLEVGDASKPEEKKRADESEAKTNSEPASKRQKESKEVVPNIAENGLPVVGVAVPLISNLGTEANLENGEKCAKVDAGKNVEGRSAEGTPQTATARKRKSSEHLVEKNIPPKLLLKEAAAQNAPPSEGAMATSKSAGVLEKKPAPGKAPGKVSVQARKQVERKTGDSVKVKASPVSSGVASNQVTSDSIHFCSDIFF